MQHLPKPDIVIFDMDGTTVRHVNPKLLHILERADDFMFRMGRFWHWLFRRGDKATIVYNEAMAEEKAHRRPALVVHRMLHKVRRKPVEQIVQPCPGIYAVLNLLKSNDIPAAIVSNGLGKGYGHDVLEKFGMANLFKSQIFREDIQHTKPNPEAILQSLKNLEGGSGEKDVVWYIGDRHKDIRAARSAQNHLACKVVPLAYGWHAALGMLEKSAAPDHILTSYFEMYEILSGLLAPKAA